MQNVGWISKASWLRRVFLAILLTSQAATVSVATLSASEFQTPGLIAQSVAMLTNGNAIYALVGGISGFDVFDVTDVTALHSVGFFNFAEPLNVPSWQRRVFVAVNGASAYAGEATNDHVRGNWSTRRLHVFDLTNPAEPRRIGGCDLQGNARKMKVSGHHVYFADRELGLQIVDVSDPAAPVVVNAHCAVPGGALEDLAITGNYVLLPQFTGQYSQNGLAVLDVSDPAHPVEIGRWRHTPWRLAADGDRAYVLYRGLKVLSLKNPKRPRLIGGKRIPATDGVLHELAAQDGFVYTVNSDGGLSVVNVVGPTRPRLIHTLATGEANDVAVMGPIVCVADEEGLLVFDMGDPKHPRAGRIPFD